MTKYAEICTLRRKSYSSQMVSISWPLFDHKRANDRKDEKRFITDVWYTCVISAIWLAKARAFFFLSWKMQIIPRLGTRSLAVVLLCRNKLRRMNPGDGDDIQIRPPRKWQKYTYIHDTQRSSTPSYITHNWLVFRYRTELNFVFILRPRAKGTYLSVYESQKTPSPRPQSPILPFRYLLLS